MVQDFNTYPLKYSFESREVNGRVIRLFKVEAPYETLGNISISHFARLEYVVELIADLEQVLAGTLDTYPWGYDFCSYFSEADFTYIDDDLDECVRTIPTADIVQLLRDWLVYLQQ